MPNFLRSGTTDYKFILCFLRILVLLGIFLVALFVRIDPILMTPEPIQFGFGPFGDSTLYHTIAYNLCAGNGYSGIDNGRAFGRPRAGTDVEYKPAVTRGPVYPVFLAAVYRLWGDEPAMQSLARWHLNWDRVRIVQSVLDALLCLVLFSAMRILYPGRYLPAILAAALYSISFYNIYYTRMLLGEGITTFLVTIALIATGIHSLSVFHGRSQFTACAARDQKGGAGGCGSVLRTGSGNRALGPAQLFDL